MQAARLSCSGLARKNYQFIRLFITGPESIGGTIWPHCSAALKEKYSIGCMLLIILLSRLSMKIIIIIIIIFDFVFIYF